MTPRSPSPSSSSQSMRRSRRKGWARKVERACCSVATHFPLAFVYGLTTWAVWVVAGMGIRADTRSITVTSFSVIGILLFVLLVWSYTTAVFTDPGSPLTSTGSGYSQLSTQEPDSGDATSFTVKSTGEKRYCKKCQARKPDRTHHCSTCGRCVLKMDHHCPWLATCVGLKNYKAFLLFLVYTSMYCWVCFGMTGSWLWSQVFSDGRYDESLTPINYVMLCVIAGIIGLVLTGFTIWHLSLAYRGQTTIECLEKTRYLSPLRKTLQRRALNDGSREGEQSYGQQLAEIHANAIPGVTRPEEAETTVVEDDFDLELGSGIRRTYDQLERSREQERYEDYLDEKDSEKLPNAFDLGWKRNLVHLLGRNPLLRCLPVCNTIGDGWHWEPNPKWVEAREAIRRTRERQWRAPDMPHRSCAYDSERHYLDSNDGAHYDAAGKTARMVTGNGIEDHGGHFDPSYEDGASQSSRVSLKTLRRKGSFDGFGSDEEDENYYAVSSDEDFGLEESRSGTTGSFPHGKDASARIGQQKVD